MIKKSLTSNWEAMEELRKIIRENEEEWQDRTREEAKRVQREEKEERLRKVKERKKKYGKLAKATKEDKVLEEERTKRKILKIEMKKNMWRSYREGGKLVKIDEVFTVSKRSKEKMEEKERKVERANILSDSWKAVIDLIEDMKKNGEDWDDEENENEKEEQRKIEKKVEKLQKLPDINKKRKRERTEDEEDEEDRGKVISKHMKLHNVQQGIAELHEEGKMRCMGGEQVRQSDSCLWSSYTTKNRTILRKCRSARW